MKSSLKLLLVTMFGSLIYSSSAKAEWDHWTIKTNPNGNNVSNVSADEVGHYFYTYDSSSGKEVFRARICDNQVIYDGIYTCTSLGNDHYINKNGDLIVETSNNNFKKFNAEDGSFTSGEQGEWKGSYDKVYVKPLTTIDADGNKILTVKGSKLLEKKSSGELHIGENSWITKEENGRQKVYAKDANGNPIPIDYTNGTKLLINGRDVEQSINNVGALSAALTGLPTVPTDTTLACGLGTGTHGGDFAFSGGCASKVNDKLSINYAASMTIPGQDYAGDFEDKFSARAGFVWKLGKSLQPTKISFKDKTIIDQKISDLEKNNKNLKAKNDEIISQNQKLLERLEKLENIAFHIKSTSDIISVATKE